MPSCSDGPVRPGYGEPGVDFLKAARRFDNIVTNPPYNAAEGFVRAGMEQSTRKLALLLRLAFLEGANRQRTIFARRHRLGCGCSASASRSTPLALSGKAAARRRMHGSCGTSRRVGSKTELKWLPLGYKARYFLESRTRRMPKTRCYSGRRDPSL